MKRTTKRRYKATCAQMHVSLPKSRNGFTSVMFLSWKLWATTLWVLSISLARGIINADQQSANVVIYLQRPNELGPRTWDAGVQCLNKFSKIFFQRRTRLTRSYNMVVSSIVNMSLPAAQIQEGYLKLVNEAVNEPKNRRLYQVRTISNRQPYLRRRLRQNEVVYGDFYLIVVDSVWRLREILSDYISIMYSWNPGAYFLVLYHNLKRRDAEEKVAFDIFSEMVGMYYVQRIALLFATGVTEYSVLVMDYYTNVACRSVRSRHIGNCTDGNLHLLNMFLSPLTTTTSSSDFKMENCTFYMCASIAAPFIEADCVNGLEIRIINFIRNRFGFEINQTCMEESRGVLDESGNWTGLLQKLNDRQCDFIMGGFYPDNEVIGKFWSSDYYLYDSHTWYVKLAELRPPWQALYSIFKSETWLCFIGLLVVSSLLWFLYTSVLPEPRSHAQLSLTSINTLAVSICVSVNERPLCAASRIFFFSLALYGLNVVSTYTSNLIAVFTDPGYQHQIDSIEQVLAAGIPFGGYKENKDWFENEEEMWIHDMYNDTSLFIPNSENLLTVKWGQRVILSSRMYMLQHNISDEVYAFPSNVFSSPVQMIMKSGFPFIDDFNMLIRRMRDMGIFEKIDRDFTYKNTYFNRLVKMRPEFKDSKIVLTTKHLEGPFAILTVGVICSTIAFIGEIFTYRFLQSHSQKDDLKEKKVTNEKPRKRPQKLLSKYKTQKNKHKSRNSSEKFNPNNKDTDDVPIYPISEMHNLRFTPLERRKIFND